MEKGFILNLVVLFFIYSFIGWVWECIYESILNRKLLNRGFLTGPYIPIYGFTGLIFYLFLSNFKTENLISLDTIKVFIISSICASIFEYVTSYVLEKILNARWWDYSNYPLNLNGRICLIASLFWGFVSVVIINIVNPKLEVLLGFLHREFKLCLASSLITLFVLDLFVTINSITDLYNRLALLIVLETTKTYGSIKGRLLRVSNPFTTRIITSFPKMKFTSEQMQLSLQKLRELMQDKRK